MKEEPKEGKTPKRTEEKWGIGDLGDSDAELFKHLPDPKEIGELLKTKARQPKKRKKRE